MKNITFNVVSKFKLSLIFVLILFITQQSEAQHSQNIAFEINDREFLNIYEPEVYIVDLTREYYKNKQLVLKCSSRLNVLDLNITFSGLEFKTSRVIFS
jgi:hypothetical protein